jgi:putative toxin-antitoxin system antitoxin component (TIGR02293 family)
MATQGLSLKSRRQVSANAPEPAVRPTVAMEVAPTYAVVRRKASPLKPPKPKVAENELAASDALSPMQTHDLVTAGLSVAKARKLMASFQVIERSALLKAMGISERTLQRGMSADKRLDSNATDRTLRLAAVTQQASEVLGSRSAAEQWLSAPAMGLDQRRPIELLQSSEGTALVKTLLTRMDYGVYA